MAIDARGHTIPEGFGHPARSDLLGLSLSIRDVIPAANPTDRDVIYAALVAAGLSPAATPVLIDRLDTGNLERNDGGGWRVIASRAVYGKVTFTTAQAGAATGVEGHPAWAGLDANSTDTSMWSAGAPTRLVIPFSGWYTMRAQCGFATNSAGWRVLTIRVNAASYLGECMSNPISGGPSICQVHGEGYLSAGDYLELGAWQNSGSTLNYVTDSSIPAYLSVSKS